MNIETKNTLKDFKTKDSKRVYYFHVPTIKQNSENCRRYTVAYTLQRKEVSDESSEDEWMLSYGATIFIPTKFTDEENKSFRESLNIPENCEGCKQNHGFCDECSPKKEELRKYFHKQVWQKRDHIQTARERLLNNPLRFILWSQPDTEMGYYNFRRIEQFILKRIHRFGVSSLQTENTLTYPDIMTAYAEHGYNIMDSELDLVEIRDHTQFLENFAVKKDIPISPQPVVVISMNAFYTFMIFLYFFVFVKIILKAKFRYLDYMYWL